MDFNFILDKRILAIQMMRRNTRMEETAEKIKDEMFEKYKQEYIEIKTFIDKRNMKALENSKYNNFFQEIFKKSEFQEVYNETQEYLEFVKTEWEKNKEFCNKYLTEVLKKENPKKTIDVYITHPHVIAGAAINSKMIWWGHFKGLKDPFYNVVYLVHEFLHCTLPYPKNYSDQQYNIHHLIIEFITDNELYSRLTKKNMYQEGHDDLKKIKQQLKKDWLNYLNQEENFSHMNINDFIKYCVNKYDE